MRVFTLTDSCLLSKLEAAPRITYLINPLCQPSPSSFRKPSRHKVRHRLPPLPLIRSFAYDRRLRTEVQLTDDLTLFFHFRDKLRAMMMGIPKMACDKCRSPAFKALFFGIMNIGVSVFSVAYFDLENH